jgi:hypothetical protein
MYFVVAVALLRNRDSKNRERRETAFNTCLLKDSTIISNGWKEGKHETRKGRGKKWKPSRSERIVGSWGHSLTLAKWNQRKKKKRNRYWTGLGILERKEIGEVLCDGLFMTGGGKEVAFLPSAYTQHKQKY